MIQQRKPTAPLAPCTGCHKPPSVEHDRRHGGTFYIACLRCNWRGMHFPTQERAEGNWGYAQARPVLRLRAAQQ